MKAMWIASVPCLGAFLLLLMTPACTDGAGEPGDDDDYGDGTGDDDTGDDDDTSGPPQECDTNPATNPEFSYCEHPPPGGSCNKSWLPKEGFEEFVEVCAGQCSTVEECPPAPGGVSADPGCAPEGHCYLHCTPGEDTCPAGASCVGDVLFLEGTGIDGICAYESGM